MEGSLRRPAPLSFQGNTAENWRIFEEEYDIYIEAGFSTNSERSKAMMLLNLAGSEAIEKARGFTYLPQRPNPANPEAQLPAETKYEVETLKRKFKEICNPLTNVILERHRFNTRNQGENEPFAQFYSDLKHKAYQCGYGDLTDELLRDRIVTGICDDILRKQLLKVTDLTLVKAVQMCQINEAAESDSTILKSSATASHVDSIRTKFGHRGPTPQCGRCGRSHNTNATCPAKGQRCSKCMKMNHFARLCKSKPTHINEVEAEDQQDIVIETIGCEGRQSAKAYLHVYTPDGNVKKLLVKLDTGAKVNVISEKTLYSYTAIDNIDTSKSKTLVGFSGNRIQSIGAVQLRCLNLNGENHDIPFQVVKNCDNTLLGLEDCTKLGLVQLSEDVFEVDDFIPSDKTPLPRDIMEKYGALFDGKLGTLPVKYKITLDPNVEPVVRPARNVPIALKPKVKEALDNMVDRGIIAPVTEPTEWVSGLVVTRKKNTDDIRICIDPGDLNKAIKRPHHPLKTIEQIAAQIPGSKYFTVVDAKEAFYHIPLESKSSYLTSFATPFGRYRYLRMPMGLCSSSDVYQRAIEQLLEGYPCHIMIDDILITGTTEAEHDENLNKVLTRLLALNLKLSPKKCVYKQREVIYLGHMLTDSGIKPDPAKVRAITDMKPPADRADLLRFLGMTKYLSKFIPDLSETAAPLNMLLKKDVNWQWSHTEEEAFSTLKKKIANTTILKYFEAQKPVTVTCDASKSGLGAACLQDDKVISFASRAMTETETRYSQIEKEMLAVVFACSRFRDYILGNKNVKVETDHQPLVSIFKKPLAAAPARLQRMLLQLQPYALTIVYKKGKDLVLADTLSRSYLPDSQTSEMEADDTEVISTVSITKSRFEELQEATAADPEMAKLAELCTKGWPNREAAVSTDMKKYFPIRDDIGLDGGVLYKGQRMIIPKCLRNQYLDILHKGHIGIEGTRRRAREIIYWPNINQDIATLISNCSSCQQVRNHQTRAPVKTYPVPSKPFETVASDMFEHNNKTYLLLVDSYSGWIEVDLLNTLTSNMVINKLKAHFARFGSPVTLITDNGPQYTAQEFKQFTAEWDIRHITSAPNHPQSNGLAERNVQTIKNLIKKTGKDGDLHLAMLNLRNTPRPGVGSPSQRNLNRQTRTPIPISEELLRFAPSNNEAVQHKLSENRVASARRANQHTKSLSTLSAGDMVRLQENKGYGKLAKVETQGPTDSSYNISIDEPGRTHTLRRTREHLLKLAPQDDHHHHIEDNPPVPTTTPSNPEEITTPTRSDTPPPEHTTREPYTTRAGRISRNPANNPDNPYIYF